MNNRGIFVKIPAPWAVDGYMSFNDATGAIWLRQWDDYVDARWFGLVNSTSINQSAVIRRLANQTYSPKVVFPHRWSFKMDSVTIDTMMHWVGNGCKIFNADTTTIARRFNLQGNASGTILEGFDNFGQIEQQDSEFDAFVYIRDSIHDITIRHIRGYNMRGDIITVGAMDSDTARIPTNIFISNIVGDNILRNGISVTEGRNVWISNVYLQRCGLFGIDVEPDIGGQHNPVVDGLHISNINIPNIGIVTNGGGYSRNITIDNYVLSGKIDATIPGGTDNFNNNAIYIRGTENVTFTNGYAIAGKPGSNGSFLGQVNETDRVRNVVFKNLTVKDSTFKAGFTIGLMDKGFESLEFQNATFILDSTQMLFKGAKKSILPTNFINCKILGRASYLVYEGKANFINCPQINAKNGIFYDQSGGLVEGCNIWGSDYFINGADSAITVLRSSIKTNIAADPAINVTGSPQFYFKDVDWNGKKGSTILTGAAINPTFEDKIEVNSGVLTTITLLPYFSSITGRHLTVVDISGTAGTNHIIINPPAGKSINGAADYRIKSNYGSVTIYYNGSNYFTSDRASTFAAAQGLQVEDEVVKWGRDPAQGTGTGGITSNRILDGNGFYTKFRELYGYYGTRTPAKAAILELDHDGPIMDLRALSEGRQRYWTNGDFGGQVFWDSTKWGFDAGDSLLFRIGGVNQMIFKSGQNHKFLNRPAEYGADFKNIIESYDRAIPDWGMTRSAMRYRVSPDSLMNDYNTIFGITRNNGAERVASWNASGVGTFFQKQYYNNYKAPGIADSLQLITKKDLDDASAAFTQTGSFPQSTISALRASTTISTTNPVWINDAYKTGFFKYSATDTRADDGAIVLKDALNRRWLRVDTATIYPRWWNVLPVQAGKSNVYNEMQSFVGYLNDYRPNGGFVVDFDLPGYYYIDTFRIVAGPNQNNIDHITWRADNFEVKGYGVKFVSRGNFHRSDDYGPGSYYNSVCAFKFNGCDNLTIEGFEISGQAWLTTLESGANSQENHGLQFNGCTNVQARDLWVHHFTADGIAMDALTVAGQTLKKGNKFFEFNNVKSTNNGRQGITVSHLHHGRFNNVTFSHTRYTDSAGVGGQYTGHQPGAGVDVEIGTDESEIDSKTEHLYWNNCEAIGNRGMQFIATSGASNIHIRGGTFDKRGHTESQAQSWTFQVSADKSTINGAKIWGSVRCASGDVGGVVNPADGNAEGITFEDCFIYGISPSADGVNVSDNNPPYTLRYNFNRNTLTYTDTIPMNDYFPYMNGPLVRYTNNRHILNSASHPKVHNGAAANDWLAGYMNVGYAANNTFEVFSHPGKPLPAGAYFNIGYSGANAVQNDWFQYLSQVRPQGLTDTTKLPGNRYTKGSFSSGSEITLGTLSGSVRIFPGDAPPTSGAYRLGDIVINTRGLASHTDVIFWECYAAGSPGSWRSVSSGQWKHQTISGNSDIDPSPRNQYINASSTGTQTLTLKSVSTTGLEDMQVYIKKIGASGTLNIVADAGVTITGHSSGSITLTRQYSGVMLLYTGPGNYSVKFINDDKFPTITAANNSGTLTSSNTTFPTDITVKNYVDANTGAGSNKLQAISVVDHGAQATWVSNASPGFDNTTAFNAAVAAAANGQMVIVPHGDWYVNSTWLLSSEVKRLNILILGNIHPSSGNGITLKGIGHIFQCFGKIQGVGSGGVFSGYTGTGLSIEDAYNCYVYVNDINSFKVGLKLAGTHASQLKGTQYCRVLGQWIYYNETQILVTTENNSTTGNWVNSNVVHISELGRGLVLGGGGTWGLRMIRGTTGTGTQNDFFNDNEFRFGAEGLTQIMDINYAQNNRLRGIRFEPNSNGRKIKINSTDGSAGNSIEANYFQTAWLDSVGNNTSLIGSIYTNSGLLVGNRARGGNGNNRVRVDGNLWNITAAGQIESWIDIGWSDGISRTYSSDGTLEKGIRVGYGNKSSGVLALTLAPAANSANEFVTIKLLNATSTISITGGDPLLPDVINVPGGSITYFSNGSTWQIVADANLTWTTSGTDIYYNTGRVAIGRTTATAKLHIGAANGSANQSQIKLDPSTLPTTPEGNTVNNTGTDLYYTDNVNDVQKILTDKNFATVINKTTLTTRKSITITISTYTVADDIDVVFANYASGVCTVNLPSASAWLDREITIKNIHATNTVSFSGGAPIESNVLNGYQSITYHSNGSTWYIISRY